LSWHRGAATALIKVSVYLVQLQLFIIRLDLGLQGAHYSLGHPGLFCCVSEIQFGCGRSVGLTCTLWIGNDKRKAS
jgi:hypothetical protein